MFRLFLSKKLVERGTVLGGRLVAVSFVQKAGREFGRVESGEYFR